ncbi:MAG: serine/threonine protein kinase, partial [Krumholzibacteria bacterium]|nr:serine/threonine protein kinase [Candidatus Krumholzibacteria bacterium]
MSLRANPDPARWQQLQALLDELLDLPAQEQARRLAALTAADADLGTAAAALLAADRAGDGPLDQSAEIAFGGLLVPEADDPSPAATFDALVGREVGPYRILDRLGEGGMAVVYRARQQNPSRLVALKILRAGVLADAGQRRRFRREAEYLARLSHPGIASVLDAGLTAEGLHYFAMELVDGRSLDTHLAGRPALGTRGELDRRLELFLRICDALTHAHQRGVAHLDLKPANIMVLPGSAPTTVPGVKVLDFGVARFVGDEVPAVTLTRDERAILGTLAYMSPEQAAGDRSAVDVRSDIYALGVLLHEILAGAPPLDLRRRSLPEAVRLIREQPAPRPEERERLLRGELATIIRKAAHVDPDQRYQAVADLAEDLRRTRARQPILARPPSTAYQLRMIVRRHRLAIGLVAAFAATLLAASVAVTLGLV